MNIKNMVSKSQAKMLGLSALCAVMLQTIFKFAAAKHGVMVNNLLLFFVLFAIIVSVKLSIKKIKEHNHHSLSGSNLHAISTAIAHEKL